MLHVSQSPPYTDLAYMQRSLLWGLRSSILGETPSLASEVVVQLNGRRSSVYPCVQVDWNAVFGPSLYWRKRLQDGVVQVGDREGDVLALQLLAAMNPAHCPVPYLQREAWTFVEHLFHENCNPSLYENPRPVLLADDARRFLMLRRRFAAYWHNPTRASDSHVKLIKEFERTLSPVKLSDFRLRASGYEVPSETTLLLRHDLMELKPFSHDERPIGLPGRFHYTDINERAAIASGERLGVHTVGSTTLIYLRPYVEDVLHSGNHGPWLPTELVREEGLFQPEAVFGRARSWLEETFIAQSDSRSVGTWKMANLPLLPDAEYAHVLALEIRREIRDESIHRPIDPTKPAVQIVPKTTTPEEDAEADKLLLTHGYSPNRTGVHTMYAVPVPECVQPCTTDTYLRYLWNPSGVFVNPEFFRDMTIDKFRERYLKNYEDADLATPFGLRYPERGGAKARFNDRCIQVDGRTWVHIEVVLATMPELPDVVRDFFNVKFGRTKEEMLYELRTPQVAQARAEGKKVRHKRPFTFDEDLILWETYRAYSRMNNWEVLHAKMPHHSIGRVKRRASLLSLCAQHNLTLKDVRVPANIRNRIPRLPDYYNEVM